MSIKVTISGEGLSFSADTNLLKAGQIISFLSDASNLSKNMNTEDSSIYAVSAPTKSPREALMASKAKTNAQKIAVFGLYLQEQYKTEVFDPTEIKNLFSRAGEPMPRNFSRDLKDAIKLNYIFSSPEDSNKYTLTERAKNQVLNGFALVSLSKPSTKRGSGTSKKSLIREEVKKIEVFATKEGYVNFFDAGTKGKQIIWLLEYANSEGLDGLSSSEISFLADRLRTTIKAKDIYPLTQDLIRKDFVTANAGIYKVRQKGIDSIKQIVG